MAWPPVDSTVAVYKVGVSEVGQRPSKLKPLEDAHKK